MTEQPKRQSVNLPGVMASTLAAIAFAIAVVGAMKQAPYLGVISGLICVILAGVIVWLNNSLSALLRRLAASRAEIERLEKTTNERIANAIAADIASDGASGVIRTPAGDLTSLNLGDTSDLADSVTGLLGERYFIVTLDARIAAARRHLRPLAVVLLEAVQDAGDAAVQMDAVTSADIVRETLRDADTLCRLKNGQFGILLEDTPENGAIWTVERIRRRLTEQGDDVTVWAGLACYPAAGFDGPEVLNQAREALDRAREWRQDRTEVAEA